MNTFEYFQNTMSEILTIINLNIPLKKISKKPSVCLVVQKIIDFDKIYFG